MSLPITVPVTIDATSQSPSYDGTPLVEIIGGGLVLQAGQDGTTGSNGSTIEGLDIVNSGGAGIIVESRGDTIVNDVLGINLSGTTASSGAPLGPETSGVAIKGRRGRHDRRDDGVRQHHRRQYGGRGVDHRVIGHGQRGGR